MFGRRLKHRAEGAVVDRDRAALTLHPAVLVAAEKDPVAGREIFRVDPDAGSELAMIAAETPHLVVEGLHVGVAIGEQDGRSIRSGDAVFEPSHDHRGPRGRLVFEVFDAIMGRVGVEALLHPALRNRQGRGAHPRDFLTMDLGQDGGAVVLQQASVGITGADGRQLPVIPDQHDLGARLPGVA